jgi:hypothetical protein
MLIRIGFVIACLLATWSAKAGGDIYEKTTGQIKIPAVVVGSTVYTNVVVLLANVLAVDQGPPYGTCDSFDLATNQLTIPVVQAGNVSYSNVLVTVNLVGVTVGGSLSAANSTCQTPARNQLPLIVDAGPAAVTSAGNAEVNIPYVSVTVCQPGTTICQPIDHILVDTGSTGLRIIASVLNPALTSLPPVTDGSGNGLAECVVFASNVSWGAVRTADVQLGGETARAIPIHVIGDTSLPQTPPPTCSSQGPVQDNVAAFGANGVLGISTFLQDCGDSCTNALNAGDLYYTCPPAGCQTVGTPLTQQLPNPVSQLNRDNNGVILALQAIPLSGAVIASGTLTLGIGTESNNSLGSATIYGLDVIQGNFTTVYNGQIFSDAAFLDSGSNGLYFADSRIPACSNTGTAAGFYCPGSTLQLSAINEGVDSQGFSNGSVSPVINFAVANAEALFSITNDAAFSTLSGAAAISNTFDWGLPFFFGRQVFTAFERSPTPWGYGPYVAY